MAILTYSDNAPLSGFLSWLQQRGMQSLCPPQPSNVLEILAPRLIWGTRAQSGDTVRMSAFLASGTATMNFGGQWMNDEGEYRRYNRTLVVDSASSPARVSIPASAGWYRDAAVSLETGGITGQTLYVTQELGRTNASAFAPFAMLAQGWLTSAGPVSGGPNPPPDPGSSGGAGGGCCLGTLAADTFDPGVASYQVNVPAGAAGRLVYLSTVYVASATVANRYINLQLNPASGFGWTDTTQIAQTASQALGYTWQLNGQNYVDVSSGNHYRGLPSELWFSGSFTVELRAVNPQVGDDWLVTDITYEIKGP